MMASLVVIKYSQFNVQVFLKKESNKLVKTEQLPPLDEMLLFSETNGHSSGWPYTPCECELLYHDGKAKSLVHFALNINVIFTQRDREKKKKGYISYLFSFSRLIEQNN